jgi:hypothetical protein
LTREEIKDIIAKLKADTDEQKGYFGIFQYGGGSDESYIKANKEGLKLFAAEILEVVTQTDDAITNAAKKTIPFSHDNAWTDENSDTTIHYIEPIVDATYKSKYTVEPETLKDTAIKYGCIAVAIFLLVSLIAGIITVVKWIF